MRIRLSRTVLAGAAAAAVLLSQNVAPAEAAPAVELVPSSIPRGPDPSTPLLKGDVILDNGLEIQVPGSGAKALLGKVKNDYIVTVNLGQNGSFSRYLRLSPDATTKVLVAKTRSVGVSLSEDGKNLVSSSYSGVGAGGKTKIVIRTTSTGSIAKTVALDGPAFPLTMKGARMVVSSYSQQRTISLNYRTGTSRTITNRIGSRTDITADRFSYYTRDPYEGGCTVVTRLSNPKSALWTSCKERVDAFSPDGNTVATIPILTDGIGTDTVKVRTVRGKLLATYKAPAYFGAVTFEDTDTLLLDTSSRNGSAVVRCTVAQCDRATDLGPAIYPNYRAPAPR